LHAITSLTSLQNHFRKTSESQKVALLLAALEVEGPDTIKIKRGPDAGREVSILKMILGDEDGQVCKLTAWREVAEHWGGSAKNATGVKRGDIIFIDRAFLRPVKRTAHSFPSQTYWLLATHLHPPKPR
jgi:hypothetical protein